MVTPFFNFFGTSLAAGAAVYASLANFAVLRGRHRTRAEPKSRAAIGLSSAGQMPLSVLKPLCGDEAGLYDNLRSFCVQSYPAFQLLFGVRDASDPAIAVVHRLQGEFPSLDIELVVDSRVYGTNLKVSNLLNILPHARHNWLLLADSDIAVERDHFSRVTAHLADSKVGVVTCLYRGVPRAGFWSRIGAQFIDDWFAPSVRVSHALGSSRFSFGATIALRREALESIGGLAPLRDTLADDFMLGEMTRQQGLHTVLSDVMVTTDVTENRWSELWAHELRWLRTIRALAPQGFVFSFITFTFPMLVVGLALARTKLCLAIVCVGMVARFLLHFVQRPRHTAPTLRDDLILPLLRDVLLLAEWIVALMGTKVRWRDHVLDASIRNVAPGFLFLLCMISVPLVG